MISSEFVNITQTINKYNNKIYWMNIIDGPNIFNISIPFGNYDSKSLEKAIENEMNKRYY